MDPPYNILTDKNTFVSRDTNYLNVNVDYTIKHFLQKSVPIPLAILQGFNKVSYFYCVI